MASLMEPCNVQLDKLICYSQYALQVLEEETLKQVRANLTVVKTNRVECEGLANVYRAGVEQIATLVPMVLRWRKDSSFVESFEEVESLSWLLLSLAEIERCMQNGGCYILSCAELLDSGIGNISVLRMISSLVREFSFSLDLVQAVFSVLMYRYKRHEHDGSENSNEWRDLAAALLVYCQPSEFFEWCRLRCRPVLKQCFLDLGQELWQFSSFVGEAAYEDQGHYGHSGDNCKSGLASISEGPSVQPLDALPLRIDHQDVEDQKYLGHGSNGTVFRCKWHDKDRAVKIVRLHPGHLECENAFEREVSILASLRHPNAVQTFGFGYTEGRAQGFYVMELMQTDLSTVIQEKRSLSDKSLVFPIDVSVDILSQIAEGLCAFRHLRVIHRDLKPANILVNRPDESMKPCERFYHVKIADFGTSKVRDGDHSVFSTLRVGTPAYMAPEVMAATLSHSGGEQHGYSWKADVYSFGMVCSEILTGVLPFRKYKGHIVRTLEAVRGGERPELPLGAGDPLRRLIEDCWKLNSEERPDVWEVRRRLWECRLFHFFMMEKPSASWKTFCFRLESRRANIKGCETFSGVGSSSPISGSKEREYAPVFLNSSQGALHMTELMEHVINIAQSSRGRGCNPVCTKLAHVLSSIKLFIEPNIKNFMKSENQRLCLANVERLHRCATELGWLLRAVASSLHEAEVGVHRCEQNSIATGELLGLFSSEVLSLNVNITELAVGHLGHVDMPIWEQISAAMDWIGFNPHNVHIAVCGTSGSGVSSFIDAFCGAGDRDAGAAPVVMTQCTSESTGYRYFPFLFDPASQLETKFHDVPGAGPMAPSLEEQCFNDEGLFVFDAIILVYDAHFSRIDVEIIKSSLRFNIPVFIVRSKTDQHIANLVGVDHETGLEVGDMYSYDKVYEEVADKYVQVTPLEFQCLVRAMAIDLEMDLRDQELLSKELVYIVSSEALFFDNFGLQADLGDFCSTSLPMINLVSDCYKWCHSLGFR